LQQCKAKSVVAIEPMVGECHAPCCGEVSDAIHGEFVRVFGSDDGALGKLQSLIANGY
jgi:hypothetical protein